MLEKNWNDLITPSNVVITAKDGDIKGTVVAEPIERGLNSSLAFTIVMYCELSKNLSTVLSTFPLIAFSTLTC